METLYDAMINLLCTRAAHAGYFNGDAQAAHAYYANTAYHQVVCRGYQPRYNTFACWGTAKCLSRLERHVATICEARRRNESPELSPRVVAYYRRLLAA